MNFQKRNGRIFCKSEGKLLAEITFPDTADGIRDIDHTFVDDSLRGQGVAAQLVQMAAESILAEGKKAKTSCSYAAKWLERHPEIGKKLRWQPEELWQQLQNLGIKPTDTIMVHSSLRALGPVEGGADGFLDALKDYLSEGLLLIPTHTWGTVNSENPLYNAAETVPCIGTLPNVAAFRPDGVRSLHPTHSIAAFGKRAAEYVAGEEKVSTPAPPDGCWGRLYQEDAKILLVGVSQNRNTYLHAVEEMLDIPDRLGEQPYTVHGSDGKGNCWEQPMRPHRNSQTNDISQFYPKYLPAFEQYGAVQIGKLGSARTEVCSARKCAEVLRKIWERASGEIGVGHDPLPEKLYQDLHIDN